jgi:hypothetical protein
MEKTDMGILIVIQYSCPDNFRTNDLVVELKKKSLPRDIFGWDSNLS